MTKQIELIGGTARDASLSQFFTPPALARKLVQWALAGAGCDCWHRSDCYHKQLRVLEPSAGNGAIVRELVKAGADPWAVELDPRYYPELLDVTNGVDCPVDFLKCTPEMLGRFDLCCGNFPFHADLEGAFTLHALEFAPRTCAIYPSNVFYSERRAELWRQVRPTRIAHIAKRPWPGATDYVALELITRFASRNSDAPVEVKVEWWTEDWR